MGRDAGQTEFDVLGETGGAKTHKHKGYGDADGGETAGDLRAAVGAREGDAGSIGYIGLSPSNPNGGSIPLQTWTVNGSFRGSQPWAHFTAVYGYTSTKSNLSPYLVTNYIIKI